MKKWLLAGVAVAALGLGFGGKVEDVCACGQDINYHLQDQCQPYPVQPGPYVLWCWNLRDGWHGENWY
jgi:hypothetical protein